MHVVPVKMQMEDADAAVEALAGDDSRSAIPSLRETI